MRLAGSGLDGCIRGSWRRSRTWCGWWMNSPPSLRVLLVCLAVMALPGWAAGASPRLPAPAGPVTDLARILDRGTVEQLGKLIAEVQARTTAEIAILTVATTRRGPHPGLRRRRLRRLEDRQARPGQRAPVRCRRRGPPAVITTGYAWRGSSLPTARSARSGTAFILPSFRAGRYGEGSPRDRGPGGGDPGGGRPRGPGEAARPARRQPAGSARTGILLALFLGWCCRRGPLGGRRRRATRGAGRGGVYGASAFRGDRRREGADMGGWSGGGFAARLGGFGGGRPAGWGAGGSCERGDRTGKNRIGQELPCRNIVSLSENAAGGRWASHEAGRERNTMKAVLVVLGVIALIVVAAGVRGFQVQLAGLHGHRSPEQVAQVNIPAPAAGRPDPNLVET